MNITHSFHRFKKIYPHPSLQNKNNVAKKQYHELAHELLAQGACKELHEEIQTVKNQQTSSLGKKTNNQLPVICSLVMIM